MQTTRCAVQVDAGIVPGQPMAEYTKVWAIQEEEWNADETRRDDLLVDLAGRANAHALVLMIQPGLVNWVRTEWIWY